MKTMLIIKDEGDNNWIDGFWVGVTLGVLFTALIVSCIHWGEFNSCHGFGDVAVGR
jgi:hypothetical protein